MKLRLLFLIVSIVLMLSCYCQADEPEKKVPLPEDKKDISNIDSIKQVDLVDYLVRIFNIKDSEKKRDSSKVKFSLFPTTSNSGDRALVTSFNAAFRLGEKKNTNISTVYFYPYISFNSQFGAMINSNVWLKKNSWNFVGEYFILNYPQSTYGLGGGSTYDNEIPINSKHIRFHQSALIGIMPHLATGLGVAFDRHYDITVDMEELEELDNAYAGNFKSQDTTFTNSTGLTLPLIFDIRDNPINATRGAYFSATYGFFKSKSKTSDTYQSLFLDARKYIKLPYKFSPVLAFRSYYWTLTDNYAPYLDLPSNRWEASSGSASRGIQKGRYRSNAMLYFESEYRFGISADGFWGGVAFVNVLAPSEFDTQNFPYWHPAGGVGVRLKFNKYSRTNVAFDVAGSKEFWSVYLNIGEAF